ncbi:hypothetical protein CLOLEP_01507 [[Clostridium] leptum DSM 753]|uniref:Uncharacterized protein n=1 Tax=[Clostridium] leptum DSM 753 TaxID=428125 RepID=A7VSG6_9FIRM|nr:hypothetical protein CLOLEP_01507 [[Clostridium] leptum DSM 753]
MTSHKPTAMSFYPLLSDSANAFAIWIYFIILYFM